MSSRQTAQPEEEVRTASTQAHLRPESGSGGCWKAVGASEAQVGLQCDAAEEGEGTRKEECHVRNGDRLQGRAGSPMVSLWTPHKGGFLPRRASCVFGSRGL